MHTLARPCGAATSALALSLHSAACPAGQTALRLTAGLPSLVQTALKNSSLYIILKLLYIKTMKRIFFLSAVFFAGILAFCADTPAKETLPSIKIDYRLNIHQPDRSNYIKWTIGSASAKDTLDVTTGASQSLTTKNLLSLSRSGKTKVGPESLRALLLFPVSPYGTIATDNLMVTSQNKQLEITFIHRGYALKLTTDKDGYIRVPQDCHIAGGLAENKNGVFTYKEEFLLPDSDSASAASVDWSKIELESDDADETSSMHYVGKIKAVCKNGILTLKGTLKGEAVVREESKKPDAKKTEAKKEALEKALNAEKAPDPEKAPAP